MSEQKHTPGDLTSRKPLDAQFVRKVNEDAMKALGDVVARRKWAESKSGSPLTTNILCAEIARLNMVLQDLLAALKAWAEHYDPAPGSVNADMFAAIAKAEGK